MELDWDHSEMQNFSGDTLTDKRDQLESTVVQSEEKIPQKNKECVSDFSDKISNSNLLGSTDVSPKNLGISVKIENNELKNEINEWPEDAYDNWKIKKEEVDLDEEDLMENEDESGKFPGKQLVKSVKTDNNEIKSESDKEPEVVYDVWRIKNEEVDLMEEDSLEMSSQSMSSGSCNQDKHVDRKKHKCHLCDFQTERKNNLKSHLLKHKKLEEVELLTYDTCEYTKMASFPIYDPVCVLLEKPFPKWNDKDQKDFLNCEKPNPKLDVNKEVKWKDRKCVRKFQMSWYSQFQWLCGSYYLKKIFCLPCLIISCKKTLWNSCGFGDFVNAGRSLKIHESSGEHLRSALGFKRLEARNSIQDAICENSRLYIRQFNENVHLTRRFMQLPIRAVLFLGKQKLSFRGYRESESSNNRGNFKELLETLVSVSPVDLQEHYKKIAPIFSTYSEAIQSELINCIAEYIDEHVENDLKVCDFFSIQVDDFTDICQKSQCSIIIRYVTDGILKERFLGFHDVSSDRSPDTLFNLVFSVIEKYDYKKKLIGQCYDGASVIAGHLNKLQAKVKEVVPQAVFVHCLEHRLNLVLEQSCRSMSNCRIFFATLSGLPDFLHHSVKRTQAADTVMERLIPTAVTSRWTSNSKILSVINNDWASFKEVFDQIINDSGSDLNSVRQSKSFLKEFNDFEFALLAIIFNDVFSQTDVLFNVLQKKSLDINCCLSEILNTQTLLKSRRYESEFVKLFELAELRTESLATNRDGVSVAENPVFEKYKVMYFEILDTVIMQITTRFEDINKIKFVILMDTSEFSNFSVNFPAGAYLHNLKECYPNIFSDNQLQRLKSELQLIYTNEEYKQTDLHNFTKLISADKDIFKEAYKLFSLILTVPSTSVSVERSFSCLKRVRTFLRNTIPEEWLTNLSKISIEEELLNELLASEPFFDDIINKFAGLKDRRIDLQFKQ